MKSSAEQNITSPWKLGIAAVAAVGLVFTAMSPALAADDQLGPNDIAGFEIGGDGSADGFNYDQWHIGSSSDTSHVSTDSLDFGVCSVTLLSPPAGSDASVTQVLKGYSPGARPTTLDEITAMFDSIWIDVAEGNVTLQIPLFLWEDSDPDPYFTTFRTLVEFDAEGVYGITGDTVLHDSTDGEEYTLDELLVMFELIIDGGDRVEILGVGFAGSGIVEGGVVNSIGFDGNAYYFGTGDCIPPADSNDPPASPTPPASIETAAK